MVLDDPYTLPFADESVDIVVSTSCLEHSEMFWLSFLEMLRVLRPTGLLYLNVSSNGNFHRYPVDCWRFYPDSGVAMVCWARRNGCRRVRQGPAVRLRALRRMTNAKADFRNGVATDRTGVLNLRPRTQDQTNLIYRFKRWRWRRYRKAIVRGCSPD